LASGTALQALEIAKFGGRTERIDGASPDGACMVAIVGRPGPALVDGRRRLGDPSKSLHKVYEAVRAFAGRLVAALNSLTELEGVLEDIRQTFQKTCRRDQRNKAGTFELLNDAEYWTSA
jgi:hypothetical protein